MEKIYITNYDFNKFLSNFRINGINYKFAIKEIEENFHNGILFSDFEKKEILFRKNMILDYKNFFKNNEIEFNSEFSYLKQNNNDGLRASYLIYHKNSECLKLNNRNICYKDSQELEKIKEIKKKITLLYKKNIKEEDREAFKESIKYSYLSNKIGEKISYDIILKYRPIVREIHNLKNEIKSYLSKLYFNKNNLANREIYNIDIFEKIGFKSCENCNIFKVKKNEIKLNEIKKYAVLGTMSSGKSTLINALLGKDILPSENQACTGKIFEISNLESKNENIEAFKDEKIVLDKIEMSTLKNINNDDSIDKIKINTDFFGIKRKIILYDTPGVNNYINKDHQKITYDFLKNNNIKNIIYILNATQI
ncbi:MAG: dynamin family protein, partial [Fusobacteriaceae bacterium]